MEDHQRRSSSVRDFAERLSRLGGPGDMALGDVLTQLRELRKAYGIEKGAPWPDWAEGRIFPEDAPALEAALEEILEKKDGNIEGAVRLYHRLLEEGDEQHEDDAVRAAVAFGMAAATRGAVDLFTDDEFARVLSWAYEGLLTTPTKNPVDRELFERLGRMLAASREEHHG